MNEQTNYKGMQTRAIHTIKELNKTSAVTPPIWQTTTFSSDSFEHFGDIANSVRPQEFYSSYGNPIHEQVEAIIADLEGSETALLMGSGMAAIFSAIMSVVKPGDHVVAQQNVYPNTSLLFLELLPAWGIECTFVNQDMSSSFEDAIRPNTKLIYAETPTNPLMLITDLRAVAEISRRHELTTIVDNTFATPVNQRPIELGIDIVIHSATKYLSGHHDVTAGAIASSRAFIEKAWKFRTRTGASLSPFDAWLLLSGLRTLALRVTRHNENALALACFLESHPKIKRVHYPGLESHPQHKIAREQMNGFTGMLSAELTTDLQGIERFINSLQFAMQATSLGGFETLIVHVPTMWRDYLTIEFPYEMGVDEGLVRISVGLEDEQDLLEDFTQALGS